MEVNQNPVGNPGSDETNESQDNAQQAAPQNSNEEASPEKPYIPKPSEANDNEAPGTYHTILRGVNQ